jgi:tripartite-type tricarboxylate transporter receptor subunit TctC
MKLPRRTFLHLAVGAAALPAVSRFACAQAYPSRPVRIVVGFPPGGNAGATFDTNGNNVTLASVLSGRGGMTKIGSGAITLTGVTIRNC